MPFFSCFSDSTAEQPALKLTVGDRTNLATSSSDTCSSVSGGSIHTFPSLPTLHSLPPYSQNAPPSSSSAKFSLVSSLKTALPLKIPTRSAPALAICSNFLYSFSESSMAAYDLTDLRQVFTSPSIPTAGAVKSVTISADAVITAHQDGKIRTWSKNSGKIRLASTLPTLSDRISRFAMPSSYVTIRRHNRRLWISHADAVSAVAVAGSLLYSVSWDKTLKIWRLSDLKCLQSLMAHEDAINAVAVGHDGAVYTGSADRAIKVWAPRAGQRHRHLHVAVATLVRHKSAVNALAVSGDARVLYSGSRDRSILVWEREESANYMSCVGVLRGHLRAVLSLSTVGIDLVVSGSADRTVKVWRRGEGYSCLCTMEGHVRGVRSVVVKREEGENDYLVCSGSLDGEMRVWRVWVEHGEGFDKKS